MSAVYDFCVIGAGIVGLATARALLEQSPAARVLVLEKERAIASHQTGHNSGVIHQGIYYKPGSLKAELSVRGARRMVEFCEEKGIAFERAGKVIVATEEAELPRLESLFERARANGVPGVSRLDRAGLREIEPHAAGLAALYSPQTAIVDYRHVAQAMSDEVTARGGCVETGAGLQEVSERGAETVLVTPKGEYRARFVVNCAGLYADAVARMCGVEPQARIIPFRGEYYFLELERGELVRGLIYPVADPQLPFLGVHFTRTIHGAVEAGPNAVLALAREGYALDPGERARDSANAGFWGLLEDGAAVVADRGIRVLSFAVQTCVRSLPSKVSAGSPRRRPAPGGGRGAGASGERARRTAG
jgi:L-2-hydroxyglutarate oxidase LhgO